jgi:signal transduction histidine kinase
MERWRIFGLITFLAVVFLIGLFLVAELGRGRLRVASDELQSAMSRRILFSEFREDVAEAALSYRSFLVTERTEHLAVLRDVGPRVNASADKLVTNYRADEPRAAEAARNLRYLAGMKVGNITSVIALYHEQGPEAALQLARAQSRISDPIRRFLDTAEQLERYEDARVEQTRLNWRREVTLARRLSVIGTLVNLLLVASATLMVLATLRRHREAMAQVAHRRDQLETEATVKAGELRDVYAHLQTVQEQERSRLARGLHDELGGLLLAARMDVSWLRQHAREGDPKSVAARLDRVLEVLDEGIDLKRRVIEELRPTLLDNMGLLAAIRWQLDETCRRAGLECACHFPPDEPRIAPRTAIALFRVVQEALTNVQKHAAAHRVDVRLDVAGDHILLSVVDDGRGIAPEEAGKLQAHGLAGMRHRMHALGGSLHVGPSPGGGTEVRAIVPREAPEAPLEGAGPHEDASQDAPARA